MKVEPKTMSSNLNDKHRVKTFATFQKNNIKYRVCIEDIKKLFRIEKRGIPVIPAFQAKVITIISTDDESCGHKSFLG